MRLYLDAKSKNKVGYVPDWIKVFFEENNSQKEITFDIQGSIDYDNTKLSCRCKGSLIPWVLYDLETGDEQDLSELSVEELDVQFPNNKIKDIFSRGLEFTVGIYPPDGDFNKAEYDVLSECEGYLELYIDDVPGTYIKKFQFDTELNV